jgi:mannose-6-phosphate isomerase-like protein (cupin superfamily)
METYNLNEMIKGWLIGNFEPSLFKTNDFEVGVKDYEIGAYEEPHFHKIATEFTVIVEGSVEMNGVKYNSGEIIKINPNEVTDFRALTRVKTVVIKVPGANNDKFIIK